LPVKCAFLPASSAKKSTIANWLVPGNSSAYQTSVCASASTSGSAPYRPR
jgi:hypothetical protein